MIHHQRGSEHLMHAMSCADLGEALAVMEERETEMPPGSQSGMCAAPLVHGADAVCVKCREQ